MTDTPTTSGLATCTFTTDDGFVECSDPASWHHACKCEDRPHKPHFVCHPYQDGSEGREA